MEEGLFQQSGAEIAALEHLMRSRSRRESSLLRRCRAFGESELPGTETGESTRRPDAFPATDAERLQRP